METAGIRKAHVIFLEFGVIHVMKTYLERSHSYYHVQRSSWETVSLRKGWLDCTYLWQKGILGICDWCCIGRRGSSTGWSECHTWSKKELFQIIRKRGQGVLRYRQCHSQSCTSSRHLLKIFPFLIFELELCFKIELCEMQIFSLQCVLNIIFCNNSFSNWRFHVHFVITQRGFHKLFIVMYMYKIAILNCWRRKNVDCHLSWSRSWFRGWRR